MFSSKGYGMFTICLRVKQNKSKMIHTFGMVNWSEHISPAHVKTTSQRKEVRSGI